MIEQFHASGLSVLIYTVASEAIMIMGDHSLGVALGLDSLHSLNPVKKLVIASE